MPGPATDTHHVEGVAADVVGHGDGGAAAGRLTQRDHVETLLALALRAAAVLRHHPEAVHGEGPELSERGPGLRVPGVPGDAVLPAGVLAPPHPHPVPRDPGGGRPLRHVRGRRGPGQVHRPRAE